MPAEGNGFYGYLFWQQTFEAGGKKYEAYLASGNGGNKIVIFKDLPLVMVITTTAYNTNYMHAQAAQLIEQCLLPAVIVGM